MGLRDWLFGKAKKPMAPLSDVLTERPPERPAGRPADSRETITKAMQDAFAKRGFQIVSDPETAALGGYTLKTPTGFRPGDMGKLIADVMAQVQSEGAIQSFEHPVQIESGAVDTRPRPGIKPPSVPAIDEMSWAQWLVVMGESAIAGWSPCRFVNRRGENGCGWVFGVVKGDFGIWRQPYPVCHHPHDDEADDKATFEPEAVLSAITHLPSGSGFGIFAEAKTAAEAVDMILTQQDWRALPQPDDSPAAHASWSEAIKRVHRTWEFNGIDWSLDWHAHNGRGGHELGIWTRNPAFLNEGKPEKLS